MPQPLNRVRTISSSSWGGSSITQRPELALLVVEIIAIWADTEAAFGRVLATLLQSEKRVGMALYLGLSSPEARRGALTAAANAALHDKSQDLAAFQLVARAMKPVRNRRNELAHGLWGVSDDLPEALLWSAQQDDLLLKVRLKEPVDPEHTGNPFGDAMYEGAQVYRRTDLESDLSDARDAYNAVYYLTLYLSGDGRFEEKIKALPLMQRYAQGP